MHALRESRVGQMVRAKGRGSASQWNIQAVRSRRENPELVRGRQNAAFRMKARDMNKRTKILNLGALTIAAALYLLTTSSIAAQGRNCAPRDAVVERLAEGYGETRQSVGLGANNAVVETFASDETGSWTITVTMPGGLTCLVASGQSYEKVAEVLPTDGNDA